MLDSHVTWFFFINSFKGPSSLLAKSMMVKLSPRGHIGALDLIEPVSVKV